MPQVRTIRAVVAGAQFKEQHQATSEFWRRMTEANGGRKGDPHDYAEITDVRKDERGWVIEYEVPAELLEQRAVSVIREEPEANCQNVLRTAKLADAALAQSPKSRPKCHILSCLEASAEGSSYCAEHQDKDARFKDTTPPTEIMPSLIIISGWNPRKAFDPAALNELKESIREHGIIEPLLVRPKGTSRYELVVGERRLRAARELGLEHVPVVVRQLTDEQVLDIMLAENLQRVDLNPIEEAHHLKRVLEMNKGLTQTDLGRRIGKSQQWISDRLRLAEAPAALQDQITCRQVNVSSAIEVLQWKDTEHFDEIMQEIKAWSVAGEELPRARVREIIKEITESDKVEPAGSAWREKPEPTIVEEVPPGSIRHAPTDPTCKDCGNSRWVMEGNERKRVCDHHGVVNPDGRYCEKYVAPSIGDADDPVDDQDLPDEPTPESEAEIGPHELSKASRDPWAKEVRTFDCKVCHQVFIDKKGMETVAMVTHLIGDGYHDVHKDAALIVLVKAHEKPIKEELLRYFVGGSELEDDVRVREHEADLAVKEFDDGSRWNGATYLEECCRNGNKEAIEDRKKRNKLTEARLKVRKEAEAKGVTL